MNAGIFDVGFPTSNCEAKAQTLYFCLTMTVRIRGAFLHLLCNAAIAEATARAHQGLNVLGVAEDSVGRLQHAQKSFDEAASVGDSSAEQEFKAELASAMSGTSTLGIPSMAMPAPAGLGCQKDLAACPVGWRAKGVLCYAGEDYSGPCVSIYDPSDMSQEEKLAFADQCKVAFQCQASSRASACSYAQM
jgi:CPW-WPC domain-containing protein